MQTCHGHCNIIYKLITNPQRGVYDKPEGKRCTICEVRLLTLDIRCKCCGATLRYNPRGKTGKSRKIYIREDI